MASKAQGFKGLARNVRSMAAILRRPVSEASRKALKPILLQARRNLLANGSYITGNLYKGMAIRVDRVKRDDFRAKVGATGKAIPEAHLVEFGTEPHWQPRRGQMHPGARPFPFLEPAYVQHSQASIKVFGVEIVKSVDAQVKRLSKKD